MQAVYQSDGLAERMAIATVVTTIVGVWFRIESIGFVKATILERQWRIQRGALGAPAPPCTAKQ